MTPTPQTPLMITVNGQAHDVTATPETPLLYVLRNEMELNAPKFGCGLSQCGACTVLVDGEAIRSCIYPVSDVAGKQVTTLEGLGTEDHLHHLQQAFIDEQAAQCGYCISGMIMTAEAFLRTTPSPDEAAIRQAMATNLCRCGTHVRIIRAIARAAGTAS